MSKKHSTVTYQLPARMREQLATLAKNLNTSSNALVVRLIQERLEVAELWPPPYDESHLKQPRRVPLVNPRSVFSREQLGFDPVITDPEQLKFEEEAKALARGLVQNPPCPSIPNPPMGDSVAHATTNAALISQLLQAGPDMPSTPLDSVIYYKRGKDDLNP